MKIEIDNNLIKLLKDYLKETSFKNVEELIEFIVKDYLEKQDTDSGKDTDKKILQERLKNLGYL